MRRRVSILVAAAAASILVALPAAATPPDAAGSFRDDDGSVHEPDINAIEAEGITSGCNPPANTNFCPARFLTRAELATLFVRAFDLGPAPPAGFQDIAGNEHAAAIDSLAAANITLGCNPPANTLFCPDRITTRGEMASFLVRAAGLPPSSEQPFIDVGGSVHRDDIAAIASTGITKGCNPPANDRYCPDLSVSRAQTASFLTRSLPGVSPIFNHLSLGPGLFCAKDGATCSRSFSAAKGIRWEIADGWYNVVPFLPGEEAVFETSGTRLEVEVNGVAVPLSELAQSQSGSLAKRIFTAVLDPIGSGRTTIVARWFWNGTLVRTVIIRVTA